MFKSMSFTPKFCMILGGLGGVLFQILAGFSFEFQKSSLGVGFGLSSAICVGIGMLGYLNSPGSSKP